MSRQPADISFDPQQTGIPPANGAVAGSLDAALAVFPRASSWTFEADGEKVDSLDEFRSLTQAAGRARYGEFVARGQDGLAQVVVQSL